MHEDFRSNDMKRASEARAVASKKQREMMGAFTEVQFAMYAAHQSDFNPYHMRKLEQEAEAFVKVLTELREAEDQVVTTMSPIDHARGVGTGVTPAELEGARLRAEAEQSTSD